VYDGCRHKMHGKKVTPQSLLGQLGANLIEKIVLQMGWIWRPVNVFDVGIDGEIDEIRDPTTGEATNCIVRVQAKATERAFASESESGLEFPCDANDLDYWLRGNVPVVLIVCRPSADEAYWVSIRDYFRDQSVRKPGRVRFDKKANRFDATSAATLRQLALPRDSGIYSAPLHRAESLYSNLLMVSSFASRIFVADTEFRDPKLLWARLNSLGTGAGPEWLLTDKKLISFQNLTSFPFDKVCDLGTCEDFDTDEWATSTDRDRQWQFIRLLNMSLKALARRRRLRYDAKNEYFYFRGQSGKEERRREDNHASYLPPLDGHPDAP